MADGMLPHIPLSALAAPFPDAAISWRVGSTNIDKKTGKPRNDKPAAGIALAYIDARDVMGRLDAVCGPENWSDKYIETEKGRIICTLSIRLDGEWIAKSDGAGDSDVESEKGAISDALKRAAVKWGIGRYLYDMESPWVDLDERGNSWVMKPAARKKLDGIHAEYVKKHFKNAGSPDAGQREQPEAQRAAGAEANPPASAPVNARVTPDVSATKIRRAIEKDMRAGKEPGLELKGDREKRLASEGDTEFAALLEDMRRQTSTRDLRDWGAMIAKAPNKLTIDQKRQMQAAYTELGSALAEKEDYAARASAAADEEFEERV